MTGHRLLCILQVNAADINGGAYLVAWSLFQQYRGRGHASWLAVGRKRSDDPNVLLIPNDLSRSFWKRKWLALGNALLPLEGKVRGLGRLHRVLEWIGEPRRQLSLWRGIEDFDFPASRNVLKNLPGRADIVHCHNLHGGYFDLQTLPRLSRQAPVILTLHDAWLLSGHCAHSFDCDRWQSGCGRCPDLTIHPAIESDATAYNWRRKREVYEKSRLYVATPSRWLMQKVDQSMLAPSIKEKKVIPNGIDLSVFRPADKQGVRAVLKIPDDVRVLLFTAKGAGQNPWKDYETMQAAVAGAVSRLQGQRLLFIVLGGNAPVDQAGPAEIRCVPYQRDQGVVARYYQAADLYVHAAHAETFPSTVLEALACGTPVVATAVGGIPEQVRPLGEVGRAPWDGSLGVGGCRSDEATGVLVAPGDVEGMAKGIGHVVSDSALCQLLGRNAAEDAIRRFDLNRQADAYLAWYREVAEQWKRERSASPVDHG